MKLTGILLVSVCVLAFFGQVQADCCPASLVMFFAVDGGACGQAGGLTTPKGCKITICADGRAKIGPYCGRGQCNNQGCDCRNGCKTGNWQQSFLDHNRHLKIVVTSSYWKY